MKHPIFYLFTDFGHQGPYLGQMESVLLQSSSAARVIDLMHDAPFARPRAASFLLKALSRYLPEGAIVIAVVDPGVGSSRKALCVNSGGRWFLGPDNGVLVQLCSDNDCLVKEIDVEAFDDISSSFHGRDLFAPMAAAMAQGDLSGLKPYDRQMMVGNSWPPFIEEVIYVDGFGNAMTGIAAGKLENFAGLQVKGRKLDEVTTFASVPVGEALCYKNSLGLLEIAVNQGSAAKLLDLKIGDPVKILV